MGARRAARILAADHSPSAPIPTARASWSPRWCGAGEAGGAGSRAVLALHGYTDYFFNTELADHFAARGFAFYALDLHKCGRSRRHGQTPHFTTDLAQLRRRAGPRARRHRRRHRRRDGAASTATPRAGSSSRCGWTGCAAAARPPRNGIGGLVLNSPFFDLQGPAILRTAPTSAALMRAGAAAQAARSSASRPPGGYGTSLHRDYAGEFDYNLDWKPLGGFPVTFGWINAIRRGQARLHRGLDVGVPNLILRSDHSVRRGHRPECDPARRRRARRRADRPLGGLRRQPHHRRADHRRQARRVPVAAGAARGGLPRAGRLAGSTPAVRRRSTRPQHDRNRADTWSTST